MEIPPLPLTLLGNVPEMVSATVPGRDEVQGGAYYYLLDTDRARSMAAWLVNGDELAMRADFASIVPKLPEATYPETMLPFLLRAHPLDSQRRSLYAWICDRFVAKVYYEVHKKRVDVRVPAGKFEATADTAILTDLGGQLMLRLNPGRIEGGP